MRSAVAILIFALLVGCAKFPANPPGDQTVRLIFTLRVNGTLRTGLGPGENGLPFVYIIALRLNEVENPLDDGPLPVVVPSGNGFVAGNATHYILWNPLVSPAYQIWEFEDETLNNSFQVGVPIGFRDVQVGDNELEFEIDLSQLVPLAQVPDILSIQVNFLTMNNTNTSGGGRLWDGLGDGRIPSEINTYFTFLLRNSQTYNANATGIFEPTGDVVDPQLDMSFWQVEVRLD